MRDEMESQDQPNRQAPVGRPKAPAAGRPAPGVGVPGPGGAGKAGDEVGRAAASVGRAIDGLVGLLGHDDPSVAAGALLALDDLGAAAVVGPLVRCLGKTRSSRRRLVVAAYLGTFGGEHGATAARGLAWAARRDPDLLTTAPIQGAIRSQIAELLSGHRGSRGPA